MLAKPPLRRTDPLYRCEALYTLSHNGGFPSVLTTRTSRQNVQGSARDSEVIFPDLLLVPVLHHHRLAVTFTDQLLSSSMSVHMIAVYHFGIDKSNCQGVSCCKSAVNTSTISGNFHILFSRSNNPYPPQSHQIHGIPYCPAC